MQRDVKIGIAIGVLLLALIGIFYWLKSAKTDAAVSHPVVDNEPLAGQNQEPVPPIGVEGTVPPVGIEGNTGVAVNGATNPGGTTVAGGNVVPGNGMTPPAPMPPMGPVGGVPRPPMPNPMIGGVHPPTAGGPTGVQGGSTPAGGGIAPPSPFPPAKMTPPPVAERTHTVVAGDTLSKIAKQYYNDESKWQGILAANKTTVTNAASLKVGMKLKIPELAGTTPAPKTGPAPTPVVASSDKKHTVAAGDTLISISRKYYGTDTKWRLIYNANREHIPNQDQLKKGLVLTIPSDK